MKGIEEKDDFLIDKYNLDEEWVRQAALYKNYADQLADANEEHEQAKRHKDVMYAEISLHVRQHPEDYNLEKITDDAVKQVVLLQAKYDKALAEVIRAKHKVDILRASTEALEHKKKGLESLIYLDGRSYFAEPKVPANFREKNEEKSRSKVFKPTKIK